MPGNADFRDSVDKTREAFRRVDADGHEPNGSWVTGDDARREAVRTAVAEARTDLGPDPSYPLQPQGLHPFFQGLLDALPEPGAEWPLTTREQWLETARNIFALLYVEKAESTRLLRAVDTTAPPQTPSGWRASDHGEPFLREQSA